MAGYSKILVPLDLGETSQDLIREAHELGRRFQSELHLLHVVEFWPIMVTEPLPAAYAGLLADERELATQRMKELMERASCEIPCVAEIRVGKAAVEILDYAREKGIDLIVMGTHGRSGVSRWMLGSVAQKVVQSAECPVLIVRRPVAKT